MWWECVVFFSSRRLHTRYWRDWSSDVCSSDLLGYIGLLQLFSPMLFADKLSGALSSLRQRQDFYWLGTHLVQEDGQELRSEERRVGKECRFRCSPYH